MKFHPPSSILLSFLCLSPLFTAAGQAQPAASAITTNDVIVAEKLFGLDLPEDKLRMMLPGLRNQQRDYAVIRKIGVSNSVMPAVLFNPIPTGMTFETKRLKPEWSPAPKLAAPANLEDAAFYSVGQLAALLKSRQITSTQLTRMYLDRLKKYRPKLNCVFNVIQGPDGIDPTLYDLPFNYKAKVDLSKLRIGYLKTVFESRNNTNEMAALEKMKSLGAKLIPLELPKYPKEIDALLLEVEAAAAFDDLTRSGQDAQLASQQAWSWPNSMRQARFVPAVEYLRAQQVRAQIIQQMAQCLKNIDVYVTPTMDDNGLGLTNLTGHPQVVVPDGFRNGLPASISFVGKLFGEAQVLALAKAYQDATGFHLQHPKLAD
jgi:Asp-tRNA(Asn)/Glu-tRNA(Gln) amidotransferase A subunit family amidase